MMNNICWLDIVILLPLLFGLIRGIMRGLVAELNALLALGLGCIVAHIWGPDVATWLQKTCEWSMNISSLIAYVVLFFVTAIVLNLMGKLVQKLLKAIKLGWVNHLFGGIFGTLKWGIIMLVIIFIVGKADQQFRFLPQDLKQQSIIYQPSVDFANQMWKQVKL